jgi:hydrogenase maturation protein HypF
MALSAKAPYPNSGVISADYMQSQAGLAPRLRLKLTIRGAVQGVGFRPFVFRLATELGLYGWITNSSQGVTIEVEGARNVLEDFLLRLESEKPPRSFIQSLESSWLDPLGFVGFEIRQSSVSGEKTALILPDIATCPDCRGEIFDPANRRHFYPFTNCTNCGPRFSIIEALPYDRANTSMKAFQMCPSCQAEYDNPRDRRFHAQPNACPVCGPHLELWDRDGTILANCSTTGTTQGLLASASRAIRDGKILALKGLGGFQFLVTASNEEAVRRLRELKHREEKPFALMFPSLEAVKGVCQVSPLEERLLCSPESPIVLLRRKPPAQKQRVANRNPPAHALANALAPGNPNLGVMLPYTPLHHLLMSLLQSPVVATSGNLSDEPICVDEKEAMARLAGIPDLFLVHNRPIVRHVDDSIARIIAGREQVLRRARGFAPLPIQIASPVGPRILAVGAHLKNTVALSVGPQVFLSQHIGDLETEQAWQAFQRVILDFQRLYEASPTRIAADAHPDYLSTHFAQQLVERQAASHPGSPRHPPSYLAVQHHLAHVLSCMSENELDPPVLGVAWDGTGFGLDGTIWGGEFFLVTRQARQRIAHLRPFRLPGGDLAVKEPRRTAMGLLFQGFGRAAFDMADLPPVRAFSAGELLTIKTMLSRPLNAPLSSSIGRLFDAVASLVGLRQQTRFEGQAAMELEFALEHVETAEAYPMTLVREVETNDSPLVLDWLPLLKEMLIDVRALVSAAQISAKFHNALVEGIITIARQVGQQRIVISGGCFQNRYLTEHAIQRLREEGFSPYWHQRVPPNDGGIALGQIIAALPPRQASASGKAT